MVLDRIKEEKKGKSKMKNGIFNRDARTIRECTRVKQARK
jgi:hypothetical protein